jgi:hypothetical protein
MIVGCLKNTQITTGKKPCVLGEASTQIPSDKKGLRRPNLLLFVRYKLCAIEKPNN